MKLIITILWGLCLLTFESAPAQDLSYPSKVFENDGLLARAMPDIAERTIALYQESDATQYLDNLFRHAASYITGQSISVDGGFVMR